MDFECRLCGKCCHDLRLPLTVKEAVAWLERGDDVQVICEALPWPQEPPAENLEAAHKRRRSFAAMSGSLPTRVVVVLAGAYAGPCPYLQPDMRCGIYGQRPLVCRIYPAEISPLIKLVPTHKVCPPDAWTHGSPSLLRAGKLVDAGMLALIQQSRVADVHDLPIKQQVCALLGIDQAAVSMRLCRLERSVLSLMRTVLRASNTRDFSRQPSKGRLRHQYAQVSPNSSSSVASDRHEARPTLIREYLARVRRQVAPSPAPASGGICFLSGVPFASASSAARGKPAPA